MSEPHRGWFRVEEAAVRKLRDTYDRQSAYRLAFSVYVTLCRVANLDGADKFTRRIAGIASDAGLSYRAAAEGLNLVKAAGLITVTARTVEGSMERAPSEYQLVRMSLTDCATLGTDCATLGKVGELSLLPRVSKNKTKNFNQEPAKNKGAAVAALVLPFDSSAFSKAWADWLEHLSQKKKPPTAKAAEAQLGRCREWGESRAIAALTHSMAGNYQGLFEPGNGVAGKPQKSKPNYAI